MSRYRFDEDDDLRLVRPRAHWPRILRAVAVFACGMLACGLTHGTIC